MSSLSGLFRTARTLHHLRLSQIGWRLRYRWQRGRPAIGFRLPRKVVPRRDFPACPLDALEDDDDPGLIGRMGRGEFYHLNESKKLVEDHEIDWCLGETNTDRLWKVTLHYHRWAWELAKVVQTGGPERAEASILLRRYLGDWITSADLSTAGSRALAWNSYSIATRIGWWCRLYHLLGPEGRKDWGPLETVFLESLYSQAAWLETHIEWDLRANHLLRDAVGLAWAGRFFEGPRARRWLRLANQIALEQSREQVLPDGGHFERSPMYHVEVMDDFLALSFLLKDLASELRMEHVWNKMARFLIWVRHPDGQVPLLNDGGFNGAPSPGAILALGNCRFAPAIDDRLPLGGRLFPEFGLTVWHDPRWTVFFDVGPVGVDYQPGHAHADTLAIEASYQGKRLFVDPGTYRYDDDESRRLDRATGSHNTITIDETDSSEVWHIFRVGRRARPNRVLGDFSNDKMHAEGAHDGYRRLSGRPVPVRTVDVTPDGRFSITDQIEGRGTHRIEGGLLLAPEWTAETTENGWMVTDGKSRLRIRFLADSDAWHRSIETRPYHPEYGLELETGRLTWHARRKLPCRTEIRIEPIDS